MAIRAALSHFFQKYLPLNNCGFDTQNFSSGWTGEGSAVSPDRDTGEMGDIWGERISVPEADVGCDDLRRTVTGLRFGFPPLPTTK